MSTDALDCREAFARLEEYVDRELSPAELERVQEHLARCEECAEVFAFERTLLETLKRRIQGLEAPPELRRRVWDALEGLDEA